MVDNFLTVDDIAKELKVSRSYAYKIIRKLNKELKEQLKVNYADIYKQL